MGKRDNSDSTLKKLRREVQMLTVRLNNLERQLRPTSDESSFSIGDNVPQDILEKMIRNAELTTKCE